MSALWQGTAVEKMEWSSSLDFVGTRQSQAAPDSLRASTLEEWVWQTLESFAGAANAKSMDAEEDEPQGMERDEHLVSLVSSITFSPS